MYGNYGQPQMQNLNFWNDFQNGFSKVMKPAAQITGEIGKQFNIPEAQKAAGIMGKVNNGVQQVHFQNLDDADLQDLNFWGDFQKGFGMVMKPAAQIASGIGSAMGGNSEYGQMASQAGNIFGQINNGVQ
jgi:hypothetical protein